MKTMIHGAIGCLIACVMLDCGAPSVSDEDSRSNPGDTGESDDPAVAVDNNVVGLMRRVADYQLAHMGSAKRWEQAACWVGIMATHAVTHDNKYFDATARWAGNWQVLSGGDQRADNQCAAQVFYDAYLARPGSGNWYRVNSSKGNFDPLLYGNLRGRSE